MVSPGANSRLLQLLDRHLTKYKNKAALIFVPERGEAATVITYQELYKRVNEVAAMLRDFAGLRPAIASPSTCP